jgi:hypothetical protein
MERIPSELIEIIYDLIVEDDGDLRWHVTRPLLQLNRTIRQILLPRYFIKLDLLIKNKEKYHSYLLQGLEFISNVKSITLTADRHQLGVTILNEIKSLPNSITNFELSKMDISLLNFQFSKISRISFDSVIFDDSICYEYSTLKQIYFHNCKCLNDSMLLFFLALNTQITHLSVSNCPISNESVSIISKLKLEYLDISGTGIEVDYLHLLGDVKFLGLRDMPYTMRQTDLLTDALTIFKSLEQLDVRGTTCALNALLNMEHFGLLELKFGTSAYLQDSSLRSLLAKFPSLVSIELSKMPLSDMALYHLIQRSGQLETLILPRQNTSPQLHLVTPATLLRLPTCLRNLKYFEAIGYPFNHDILLEFATHSQQLEYLFIGNTYRSYPFITEKTIEYLLDHCPKLKKLGCQGLGLNHVMLKRLQKQYYRTLILY